MLDNGFGQPQSQGSNEMAYGGANMITPPETPETSLLNLRGNSSGKLSDESGNMPDDGNNAEDAAPCSLEEVEVS